MKKTGQDHGESVSLMCPSALFLATNLSHSSHSARESGYNLQFRLSGAPGLSFTTISVLWDGGKCRVPSSEKIRAWR